MNGEELKQEISDAYYNDDMCSRYDLVDAVEDIVDENAKLRELVRDMNECLEHSKPLCKKCKFQERGCQWFEFERRMSELGVDA